MTLNRLSVIGNLGADPELRYTPSGKAVADLRIAVNNGVKQPDGSWSDDTLWINAAVWEQAAERLAEQLRKGNKVYAEGQLMRRDYTTNDGRAGTSLELRFARVFSLERRARDDEVADDPDMDVGAPGAAAAPVRPRGAPARPRGGAATATAVKEDVDVDDIPF
ncbi:MAG TPA: single-stranded DNA-binding protein [Candidatus Limnocylindrales bacterium]|nr:single-stranded DNA-binding protein [Candidatus Limnocylindrales bacterium]